MKRGKMQEFVNDNMAEREGTGSFDRKRAVSLLQEATRLITEFSGESQNARSVVPQSVSDTRTEFSFLH